ncbi:hypothetical protein NEFER03_0254 [Nematocida sp. LUAm3]|nr:hypothetical protein NEFER03_0254 [Nematocida sp. LUAm3]KAI5173707.1 hypothetical protein NEFER02_0223 [Nematocida sp. LUAm2]KAI5176929.1 hypothetical protein NEFER01_0254 [Nematocida sp. LUAm1]
MQTHCTLIAQEEEEQEILLQNTVKAIRQARSEVVTLSSVVSAQGEKLDMIERKITSAESTLKRAGRQLNRLLRRSKKRRLFALCLLGIVTIFVFTIFWMAIFKG